MRAAVIWKTSAGLMPGNIECDIHSERVDGLNSIQLERICGKDPFQLIDHAVQLSAISLGFAMVIQPQLLMPETLDALNCAEAFLTQQPCL